MCLSLLPQKAFPQLKYQDEEIGEVYESICSYQPEDEYVEQLLSEEARYNELKKNYTAIEGSRFQFLGKGGYSVVFYD